MPGTVRHSDCTVSHNPLDNCVPQHCHQLCPGGRHATLRQTDGTSLPCCSPSWHAIPATTPAPEMLHDLTCRLQAPALSPLGSPPGPRTSQPCLLGPSPPGSARRGPACPGLPSLPEGVSLRLRTVLLHLCRDPACARGRDSEPPSPL